MKKLIFITLCTMVLSSTYAQNSKLKFSLNVNHNLYLPRNSENKTLYFIGFPNDKPSFGSFGIGFSSYYQLNKKFVLKGNTHFSCLSYIEPELDFRDKDNNLVSSFNPVVKEYQNAWSILGHYKIGENLSFGAGLGANVGLFGTRKINLDIISDRDNLNTKLDDRKRVLPVIPFEVSYTVDWILLNMRLEYGLLNRCRGDLAKFKKEKINMLYFEIGFLLNKKKSSDGQISK